LYFDESGDHSYRDLNTVHRRYLALCGAIFREDDYRRFQENWERMKKRFFNGDPDEPIVLHRSDVVNHKGIFSVLRDHARRAEFDAALVEIIRTTPFVGIIVVIDKEVHWRRYAAPMNPYHLCLVALLQRYCLWLGSRRGDVMGESRGRREDRLLKAAYEALYESGDWYYDANFYQSRLTSKEIKLKPKHKNVAGLQLVDLLAHPAKLRCLINHGVAGVSESRYGEQVADCFWAKLRRKPNGETKGWGEVFIC
jgi:hypothetical protein